MATKRAKTPKVPDLPPTVYVYQEDSGDGDYYLCATKDIEGIENDTIVGTYEFIAKGRIAVGTRLEAL